MLRKTTLLLITIILFVLFSNATRISKKVLSPIPNQDSDKWLLAHIDVEITGLIPGYHEMIDIGMVMTDLSGNIIDSLFLRIQPKHPERLEPGAFKVNLYNYVLDIPSMAWGLGVTHNQIMDYYKIEDEPEVHAGNTGAMLNVRVYKGILRYRKEMNK